MAALRISLRGQEIESRGVLALLGSEGMKRSEFVLNDQLSYWGMNTGIGFKFSLSSSRTCKNLRRLRNCRVQEKVRQVTHACVARLGLNSTRKTVEARDVDVQMP